MQYGIEPEFCDMTLADSSDVQYDVRKRKTYFKDNVFPPYKSSKSDAHEWAERWSRSPKIHPGDTKLVPYHNRWYLIEAVDDSTYGYRIIYDVDTDTYDKEVAEYASIAKRTSLEGAYRRNAEMHRRVRTHSGGGRSSSSSLSQHGRESDSVYGMDSPKDQRRESNNDGRGNPASSNPNLQRRSRSAVNAEVKQLRAEIRVLEDQKDFAYDKIEKRSIQEEIDEREYRIRQLKAEIENQPQFSDRIEEESSVPADITEEMRQRGEKAIETATAQRESKVAAEQKTHRAIRAALTNRDLIPQNKGKGGGFADKNAHIQQWKAEEETAYIAESCFGKCFHNTCRKICSDALSLDKI